MLLWLDAELLSLMKERDLSKSVAFKSKSDMDRKHYCKLRNRVTKLNIFKKKEYFKQKICNSANDSKQLWKVLNELMCKKPNNTNVCVESSGDVISKPCDIANHLNIFFIEKVDKIRSCAQFNTIIGSPCNNVRSIMSGKSCSLTFGTVKEHTVEKMLLSLPDDKTPGIDHLDGKLFKSVSHF